jgi:hypothetical protein
MFNLIICILGCLVLIAIGLCYHRAGLRTFLPVMAGLIIIVATTLLLAFPQQMLDLAGLILAIVLVAGLLVALSLVIHSRRRIPRYQAPATLAGRCSQCGYTSEVKRTVHGWLCVKCQTEKALAGRL